ncbi:uncharacterized protein SCODWIG_00393 [Saccharomycodes ludwigii]|uniref:Cytochrome c oxidase copper chaperone n=1 Tax=Saccharomycodes ludwigii TaxID=36035 RepID=A0A376B1X0_9ASCO|nr:hypothetical protein SCDLUD_004789 [Saccharomycodes ludwigii]KAH3899349.1 hypothetical protein SCDLUD_004789 [Saccharomycodes ludwigii]SSD58632.1 uncharacterized protein SCODWIG_00393 [Saccharomycodes ludwigii]
MSTTPTSNNTTDSAPLACPNPNDTTKPKPCCVCLDEKKDRDECLLFKGLDDVACKKLISNYKSCMKGYGFDI